MSNLSKYLTRPASDHPPYLAQGQKARLFPVLRGKQKEQRYTSIFLSCLSHVQEFGAQMLESVGQSVTSRTKIQTYTEVTFPSSPDRSVYRPDGLIVMKYAKRKKDGKSEWRALVETKVDGKLEDKQVSGYVELAHNHNIDAVITISNQFTSKPEHHPIKLSTKKTRVKVYHWSWWYIVTQAYLLISNTDIDDPDQHFILEEMLRFLEHSDTGVTRFDSMPPKQWRAIVQKVAHGSSLQETSDDLEKIISSWHQEVQDINLMLSCKINDKVKTKLLIGHANSPKSRIKYDIAYLKRYHLLTASLEFPNVDSLVELKADIKAKVISASMMLDAPIDKKRNITRINWIQKQLQKSKETMIYVYFHWKGHKPNTQVPLKTLNKDAKNNYRFAKYEDDIKNKQNQIVKFEVSMIQHFPKKFADPKNFISCLENLVSNFHENVVQNFEKSKPKPPASKKTRKTNNASSPANVTSDEAHGTAQEEA